MLWYRDEAASLYMETVINRTRALKLSTLRRIMLPPNQFAVRRERARFRGRIIKASFKACFWSTRKAASGPKHVRCGAWWQFSAHSKYRLYIQINGQHCFISAKQGISWAVIKMPSFPPFQKRGAQNLTGPGHNFENSWTAYSLQLNKTDAMEFVNTWHNVNLGTS